MEAYEPGDYLTALNELCPLAEQGDASAQYKLGLIYAQGSGLPQDYAQARQWFEQAAAQGNAAAQYELACLYGRGDGTPQDDATARYWLEKAGAQGQAEAQSDLGWMYARGEGVLQDYARARQWLEKAAAQGDIRAHYDLADLYCNGYGVPQDLVQAHHFLSMVATQGSERSVKELERVVMRMTPEQVAEAQRLTRRWYENAAEQGDALAQYNLGWMYERGEGVPKDYVTARQWYEKASAPRSQGLTAGHARAQLNLGLIYHNGHGVPQDYAMARQWYEKAAASHVSDAESKLGDLFRDGLGVQQDYAVARQWYEKARGHAEAQRNLVVLYAKGLGGPSLQWYEKAAAEGDARAQYDLGMMYHNGYGVSQDDSIARQWLEKSAAQGDAQAQKILGWLYDKGAGGPRDFVQAANWYEKAAAQGDATVQGWLGLMYANGRRGVPQDLVQAHLWLSMAAAQGNKMASQERANVAMRMTPAQIAEAQKQARDWPDIPQDNLFEIDAVRALLDQLLADSKLYTKSKDYKDLLDFVVRLRNFAPFNAMLLQMQKPGLSYAASARDWYERFNRTPKEGARPLLILWPFGPVALVYDVQDTEGNPLPEDVDSFFAHGPINPERVASFAPLINKKNIEWFSFDGGDQKAGSIRVLRRAASNTEATYYRMNINRNHTPAVQFVTLAHELGHLFLGHLGPDGKLNVPSRPSLDHAQMELEAESVSYIVCARNGVASKAEVYMAHYVTTNTMIDDIDIYQVMRAAGQVETLLGLTAHTKYALPNRTRRN